MSTRKLSIASTGRGVMLASIAALVVTMAELPSAAASTVALASNGISASTSVAATDFSSARRRRYVRRNGNAAGLAFMGLAIGTIGAIAAQQRRDDYYDNGYGYRRGYYGGEPYYGPGYRRY
jgi:hypothetical protein